MMELVAEHYAAYTRRTCAPPPASGESDPLTDPTNAHDLKPRTQGMKCHASNLPTIYTTYISYKGLYTPVLTFPTLWLDNANSVGCHRPKWLSVSGGVQGLTTQSCAHTRHLRLLCAVHLKFGDF